MPVYLDVRQRTTLAVNLWRSAWVSDNHDCLYGQADAGLTQSSTMKTAKSRPRRVMPCRIGRPVATAAA
jgi:hypothetical protein